MAANPRAPQSSQPSRADLKYWSVLVVRAAAVMLYFCIIDGHNTDVMLPIAAERNQMVVELGSHAHFRTTNASGRYRLDLSVRLHPRRVRL